MIRSIDRINTPPNIGDIIATLVTATTGIINARAANWKTSSDQCKTRPLSSSHLSECRFHNANETTRNITSFFCFSVYTYLYFGTFLSVCYVNIIILFKITSQSAPAFILLSGPRFHTAVRARLSTAVRARRPGPCLASTNQAPWCGATVCRTHRRLDAVYCSL